MVVVVDDLLLKPVTSFANVLHAMALEEKYDESALRDDLKENRLLYELGERTEEAYRERKRKLEADLERARAAKSQLSDRIEIKR